MAKQRPALIVASQPTSTFISPGTVPFAGVELYDQQTVNLALQFSDAFKDLSQTAASVASGLRQQQNKENLEAGRDLVNQSQKTYQELVQSGQISPAENPWLAVGAQEASGTIQGMRARAAFTQVYEQKVQNDPKFLESQDSFNALAASFAEQMNQGMGDASYMNRAFYEAFNPFISSMAMKHQENVVLDRKNRVLAGVGAEVAKTVQDMSSQDPIIRETAASVLQEQMDKMGQMGLGRKDINEAVIDNLVALMYTSDEPEKAENLLNSLKSGTDLLSNTAYAQNALNQNRARIEANRNRMTMAESEQFYKWFSSKDGVLNQVLAGKMTKDQALEAFNELLVNPGRKITLSPQEVESKRGWILSEIDRGLVMQARQQEEDNKNELLKMMNERSQRIDLTKSSDEQYGAMEDEMESAMKRMQFTEEQKMQFRGLSRKIWDDGLQKRQAQFIAETTQQLWDGTLTQRGLKFEVEEQFKSFLTPLPNINDPSDSALTTPSFEEWQDRISRTREIQGIPAGSPEAKTANRIDHMRLSSMLDQMESSQDLKPNDQDNEEQKFQKSVLRGRYKFLRLNLDRAFGQRVESTRIVEKFVANLDPSRVQAGGVTWPMEDYLRAYTMYRQRNLPMEDLFSQGPFGEAIMEELNWAAGRIESGDNVTNIVADLASLKSIGRSIGVNPFEMQSNPLGWARWITKTEDRADFASQVADFMAGYEITNTDANIFVASEFKQAYLSNLASKKNHADAMEAAKEVVLESNIMFRGSMIPKRGLPAEAQDPEYLAAWVDTAFPGEQATLVVIQRNFDGSVLMAPRDANGNLIPGARAITSRELGQRTPEQIKNFGEAMRKARIQTPTTERERIRRMAEERVFNPMIPLP